MRTGKLDQRVTIEELQETNDFGEVVKAYVNGDTVWADVISQKGSESFDAARMGSTRMIKVKMRYRSDILTDWRIRWMEESYNIVDIDRSLRREGELWLMCKSVVAE